MSAEGASSMQWRKTPQGQRAKNDARPHAPSPRTRTTAPGGSLWRQDTLGDAMPVARRDGRRRCRMHSGAPGSGGPKGSRNGNYKHGRYTAEAIASRRWVRQLIRDVRALTERLLAEVTVRDCGKLSAIPCPM